MRTSYYKEKEVKLFLKNVAKQQQATTKNSKAELLAKIKAAAKKEG